MASLLVVALCLGAGVLLRARLEPAPLNAYLLHIALPAVALVAVRDAPLSPWAVASVWLVFLASALFFAGVGRLFGWGRATVGCLVLTCGMSNTSFVGFPLLEALIGPGAIPTGVAIDQFGSFLLVCTLAPVVGAIAAGQAWSARALAARMVRFPALWAVIAALIVPAAWWPSPLIDALDRVGDTLSPVALVTVGAQLRLPDLGARGPFAAGLVYKLVLAPLLVVGWMRASGEGALVTRVAVLEAAMPPMVTGALLAQAYGLRGELAGALLGVGVPLGLLTVWGWDRLVGG